MSRLTAPQASVTAAIAVFAVTSAIFTPRAESESLIDATNTTEARIARAKSAGPPEIALRDDCRQGWQGHIHYAIR